MSSAPVIALIGGLAMRGAELEPLAQKLGARGYRALTFDNLQVGDGPRVKEPSIQAQADHAWRQVDTRIGPEARLTLFGMSMGGMIAATMAAQQPARVVQLLLGAMSPNVAEAPSAPKIVARADDAAAKDGYESMRVIFGTTTESQRPQIIRRYHEYRSRKGNGQSKHDLLSQMRAVRDFPGRDVIEAVARAKVRSLVICGEEDRLYPRPHSDWIAAKLGCSLEMIPRAGHMLHLEEEERLARVLAESHCRSQI